MERSKRFERSHGLAVLLLLAVSVSLGGCATAPPGETQLTWFHGSHYTVHSGDTLSEIADRYGVSEAALQDYNSIDDPHWIYPGEVLRIPRRAEARERVAQYSAVRPTPRPAARRTEVAQTIPRPTPRQRYEATAPEPQKVEDAQGYTSPLQFTWPVIGRVIQPFGSQGNGERNDGINIAARRGEPIRAAAAGTVTYAGDELKDYGNLILIRHDDGYVTAYAHAQSIAVSRGEHVAKGQVIGYAGSTGNVARPQLHFEIRHGARPVDPKPLLVAAN
ncbi:MAG: M23 family metallopeptidase [Alphaproteobacteria bacterium]|nr:M23 family metallopeptidase [Alphaproteobacteria bacterium]MDE2074213.1 M23 family metallopeptidase [Alphaproteobacteria bacterium]